MLFLRPNWPQELSPQEKTCQSETKSDYIIILGTLVSSYFQCLPCLPSINKAFTYFTYLHVPYYLLTCTIFSCYLFSLDNPSKKGKSLYEISLSEEVHNLLALPQGGPKEESDW